MKANLQVFPFSKDALTGTPFILEIDVDTLKDKMRMEGCWFIDAPGNSHPMLGGTLSPFTRSKSKSPLTLIGIKPRTHRLGGKLNTDFRRAAFKIHPASKVKKPTKVKARRTYRRKEAGISTDTEKMTLKVLADGTCKAIGTPAQLAEMMFMLRRETLGNKK